MFKFTSNWQIFDYFVWKMNCLCKLLKAIVFSLPLNINFQFSLLWSDWFSKNLFLIFDHKFSSLLVFVCFAFSSMMTKQKWIDQLFCKIATSETPTTKYEDENGSMKTFRLLFTNINSQLGITLPCRLATGAGPA